MDVFKHFIAGLYNISAQSVYIIVHNYIAISPRLLNYVKTLKELKYENGKEHLFYNDVKNLVCSFVFFWTMAMDEALIEGNRLAHSGMDKATLLTHIDKTIKFRECLKEFFDSEFIPAQTPEEQQVYDEVITSNEIYMKKLKDLRAKVENFDKQEYVDELARREFPKSVTMKNNGFLYAHTYISMLLADRLPEIRGSLQEIVQQLNRNLTTKKQEVEEEFNSLLIQLYEKNKELLILFRKGLYATTEAAELKIAINKLREGVAEKRDCKPINGLVQEAGFFVRTLEEFERIATTLTRLKTELEYVERELAVHDARISTELPGSKLDSWQEMEQNYKKQSAMLKEELLRAAKSLLTFFCVRGTNRAVYTNNAGPYHLDEFGHQVYHFEFCLKTFHLDCNGEFKETTDQNRYYYDDKGRYFLDDGGEKVYHLQDCTSLYKIGDDTLMKKITVDCGHSEFQNKDCGINVRDPNIDAERLPRTEPVDIPRTMNPETARYLWDTMGAILPDALYDVGMLRPKNPIHYLAHRLLAHKYGKTKAELLKKKEEADAYRAKILKDRTEKAATECKAWRSKQFPRKKRADIDDDHDKHTHSLYSATNELIQSLVDFYND